MVRRSFILSAFTAAIVLVVGCSSSPWLLSSDIEFDRELEAARSRWVAANLANYTFEYHMQTAWFPPGDYTRIEVRDRQVVAARNAVTGAPLPVDRFRTVEQIWNHLIAARDRGETLSELSFNRLGVPLSAMVGTFADDGGVHHSIRRFELRR